MTFLGPSGPIFYIDIDMYIFFSTSRKRTASIAVLQTHRSMGHTGRKRERERILTCYPESSWPLLTSTSDIDVTTSMDNCHRDIDIP